MRIVKRCSRTTELGRETRPPRKAKSTMTLSMAYACRWHLARSASRPQWAGPGAAAAAAAAAAEGVAACRQSTLTADWFTDALTHSVHCGLFSRPRVHPSATRHGETNSEGDGQSSHPHPPPPPTRRL